MTGNLHVVASRRDERTIVDTLRQEGLARCSRPFALPGGGARIVTMQLGPGYVRGDRFTSGGTVGPGADLSVTAQAATRALGRGEESVAAARWHVAAGGTLRLLAEPLVVYEGARHRATTDVELETGATLVYLDVVVSSGTFARVSTRLRVHAAERLLLHDAIVIAPGPRASAVGTAFAIGPYDARPLDCAAVSDTTLATADAAAQDAMRRYDVLIGIGRPACGGVSLRATGDGAANVHAALACVLGSIARAT